MEQARLSVCQFFEDGSHEYIQRAVSLDVAVETFIDCVAAASSCQVLITDGQKVLEWTFTGGFRRG